MDRRDIDVNKLEKAAEAGHGHFVRAVLDEMSFQDRLRVLQQVQALSEEHHHQNPEAPYLEVRANVSEIVAAHCAYVRLDRHVPHRELFGLLDKSDVLYQDTIGFPKGDEFFEDADVFD